MANKINMPLSQAGITRYFDDFKGKIEISPKAVIVFIVIIVILEIFLHLTKPFFY